MVTKNSLEFFSIDFKKRVDSLKSQNVWDLEKSDLSFINWEIIAVKSCENSALSDSKCFFFHFTDEFTHSTTQFHNQFVFFFIV